MAWPRSSSEPGGSVVFTSTTALKYVAWVPGSTPHGSVSYTGETALTRRPGVSSSASTAPWRVSRRLPRLLPREITARLGLDRVTSAASTFSTTEAGTGCTVGSLLLILGSG